MHWRLNRIQYPIYNLGHGKRIGIWVQGCRRKCEGCISPSLQTFENGKDVSIEELLVEILKVSDSYDGITISGGEPFEQYNQLVAFSTFIKQKTELDIFCFSGYTLFELKQKFPDLVFMDCIDYLLDGPYQIDKHEDKNIRGSTNQNFYRFINGKAVLTEPEKFSGKWSINVSNEGVYMTGIPKFMEMNKLKEGLEKNNVFLEEL